MSTAGNRARARDLADNLTRARHLADDPGLTHARDLCFALVDALVGDLNSALVGVGDLDRALTRVGDLADDLDRARAHALADDLLRARAHARDLADELARIHDDLGLTCARDLADEIDSAYVSAYALAADLDLDRADARTNGSEQPGTRRVAPSAAGLLTTAARLLPAADRSRYAEEYRSELWDIAQAGGGRIKQWRYAFCQLRNALPMHVAVRSPRRRSSVP